MLSNRDIVDKTKTLLKNSYLKVFASLLLASIIPQIITAISPQNVALHVVSLFVSGYIQVGIAFYCLELYKGKDVGLEKIFSGFKGYKPVVILLLYVVVIFLGFILLIVPGIILALMYSQVFFILAEDPDVGVIEAFNLSHKMMKNNKMQLFMLNLEALFYFFIGVFTLFIWWIWLIPRYSVAYAGFYDSLKSQD